ncbi:hypothetical protein DIPPA_61362 [Diplonema papillatum]|nr:hypothetical protein DIPPA_61362 [Diplonema papillatum]
METFDTKYGTLDDLSSLASDLEKAEEELRELKKGAIELLGEDVNLKSVEETMTAKLNEVARTVALNGGRGATQEEEILEGLKAGREWVDKGDVETSLSLLKSSESLLANAGSVETESKLRSAVSDLARVVHSTASDQLRKQLKQLPLLETTEGTFSPQSHDQSELTTVASLWRVASIAHIEYSLPDPSTNVLAAAFTKEFCRHFEGNLPTADAKKPEWPLRYTQRVIQNHWSLLRECLLPVSHASHFADLNFFNAVLDVLAQKMAAMMTSEWGSDEQKAGYLYYCLNEVLKFEGSLSNLPMDRTRGLLGRVLKVEGVENTWLKREKARLNEMLEKYVWSDKCWVPASPLELRKFDEWKAGLGAVELHAGLQALASKLANVSEKTVETFVSELFVPSFQRYCSRAEDLVDATRENEFSLTDLVPLIANSCSMHQTVDALEHHPFARLITALNSLCYLLDAISQWLVLPAFCNSTAFTEASDCLASAHNFLLKATASTATHPFTHWYPQSSAINEENGGVLAIFPPLRQTATLFAFIAGHACGNTSKQLSFFCYSMVEKHLMSKLLPLTDTACKTGLIEITLDELELASQDSLGSSHFTRISCFPMLSEALLCLSLPSTDRQALKAAVSSSPSDEQTPALRRRGIHHITPPMLAFSLLWTPKEVFEYRQASHASTSVIRGSKAFIDDSLGHLGKLPGESHREAAGRAASAAAASTHKFLNRFLQTDQYTASRDCSPVPPSPKPTVQPEHDDNDLT